MKKITKTVEMTLFIPWNGKMTFHNEEDIYRGTSFSDALEKMTE